MVQRGVEASADNALGLLSSLGHLGNSRGAILFGGTNRLAFPPAASPPPTVTSAIQCASGHPCTPHTYSHDENSCDLCHRDIDAGSAGLRCSACDFDVCDTCSSTSPPFATSSQPAFGVDAASLSPAMRLPLHPSASASPPQPSPRSVLEDLDAFDANALRMAHHFAGQMLRLPSLSVVNLICLHADAAGARGVCVPASDAGRMNLCKCSVSTSLALKMCSMLFGQHLRISASNSKIMRFCLSIIARGYRGRNVLKFERRCATAAVAPLYHAPLLRTLPLALQLAYCCPCLLSLSPSRLMRSQSNTRTIVFSDNDTAVKLPSFALMPVAVAVPVGTRCRFKVQLMQAPPSLGATSFGVATSSVGLERISTIGNQRNT